MEETKGDYSTQLKVLEGLLAEEFRLYAGLLRQDGVAGQEASQLLKNRLVEQLQYHDIIRQKIEHVRHFQELREQSIVPVGTPETSGWPKLLELSLALLRYTGLEYAEVRVQIQGLIKNSKGLTGPLQQESAFDEGLKALIHRLEEDYLDLESSSKDEEESISPEKLRQLWDSFSMKSEREVWALFFEELPAKDPEDGNMEHEGHVELF